MKSDYRFDVLESNPTIEGMPPLLDVYSIATRTGASFRSVTLWTSTYPAYISKTNGKILSWQQFKDFTDKGLLTSEAVPDQRNRRVYRKNSAYHVWKVPKRRKGEYREIQAPHPHLKSLQRRLLEGIFSKFPFGPEVTAFREGMSIVDNAQAHSGGVPVVISLDIENFFPSITQARLHGLFGQMGYPNEVCWSLSELVTYRHFLPQGAPTSPCIANIVGAMTFDPEVKALSAANGYVYTRYADDLTFSLKPDASPNPQQITAFVANVVQVLEKHRFYVNSRKTKVMHAASQKQMVTGTVVNNGHGSIVYTWPEGVHPFDVRAPRKLYHRVDCMVRNCQVRGLVTEHERRNEGRTLEEFINQISGSISFMKQVEQKEVGDEKKISPRVLKLEDRWETCLEIYQKEKETTPKKIRQDTEITTQL